MQWILILCGLALMLLAVLLTYWLQKQRSAALHAPSPYHRPYCHVKISRKMMRLLQRTIREVSIAQEESFLLGTSRQLMEHILCIQKETRHSPVIPGCEDNEPRLMGLARETADADQITPQTLLQSLAAMKDVTPAEISVFPLCVKIALCDRLTAVLYAVLRDVHEIQHAKGFARRMHRHKTPLIQLEKRNYSPTGLSSLISFLRDHHHHEQLAALDQWLTSRSITFTQVAHDTAQRQVKLAEEIRRSLDGFEALSSMGWISISENIDPVHQLLSKDPADIYPRMCTDSRLDLRLITEKLSRRFAISPERLLQAAQALSRKAEPRTPENYIGYWLQDADGLHQLQRELCQRRGKFYALFSLRRKSMRYAGLWCLGLIAGFMFLQGRQPVFMLPAFVLTAGCIARRLLPDKSTPLPALDVSTMNKDLRTLVVLPAVLHDPHEAIRMVRRMKIAQNAFPESNMAFMLLGDFADNMTAVSSTDAAIIHAASSAIAALDDNRRFQYLQRARTWDGNQHVYTARGGQQGAIREICRLISQGECMDVIAFSSVEAAALERQYAYVFVLPPDKQPAPGMFIALLQRMIHPLSVRYPDSRGWRGYSILAPEKHTFFDGAGLIRPDVYLEATDGLIDSIPGTEALSGELAGYVSISGAHCHTASIPHSWGSIYQQMQTNWRLLRWQLPYVQTPSGLVANPLKYFSRFRLREMHRNALVPCAQLILLLWAILTNSWLLLLIALLAPENKLHLHLNALIRLCHRISTLPMRALVNILALLNLFRRHAAEPTWSSLELWAQWIFATLLIALGLALPHMTIPALALGLLFACQPWLKHLSSAPLTAEKGVTEEQSALLEDITVKTWRYFSENVTEQTNHLPPAVYQYEPPLGKSHETSPEAIGSYLLSCVCAKELGLLNANSTAARIRQTLESIAGLSFPYGLPCSRYALNTLMVTDARSDAACVGILLAALMVTAQALRTWLPEMSSVHENLSAMAEGIAASIDLSALYNSDTQRFYQGLDQNGQPVGSLDYFTDESLLLSVAACARRLIPPSHFHILRQPMMNWRGSELALSAHGNASAHLLAGLFVPCDERQAQTYILAMIQHGHEGLFGQDECYRYAFNPDLRYRKGRFGIEKAALVPIQSAPVYTPYAAALCLPYVPYLAANTLVHYKTHGALGPYGMCDAIDFTSGAALVGLFDSFHQGLMLTSAAHLLADSPIRRYFCDIPEIEACLPLLTKEPSIALPPLPLHNIHPSDITMPEITPDMQLSPPQAHLIGSKEFHLIADSHGNSAIYEEDIPLTHFDPCKSVNGVQLYLADEGRWYRLSDANLTGQTLFSAGEIRIERYCGSLKTELLCTVDTVQHRALHVLTITNLSTRDRVIEAADCLLPDMNAPQNTLEVSRPSKKHLSLHARNLHRSLHHSVALSQSELSIHACSDAYAFLGHNREPDQPASLAEPPEDFVFPSSTPCLSFRIKLTLGGRGQTTLWFCTSTEDLSVPTFAELTGIRQLAALQHHAIAEAASLTAQHAEAASILTGLLRETGSRITFILHDLSALPTLMDLVHIVSWFKLHGVPLRIEIHCSDALIPPVQEALQAQLSEDMLHFNPPSVTESSVKLYGNAPLQDQLLSLCDQLPPQAAASRRPVAALLPKLKLHFQGPYGGFDPETGGYVIQLEPGQTTPLPWTNTHMHDHYREQVDESGFRSPFEEQVRLFTADGTEITPWSEDLPRSIHMDAGLTSWETWTDQLDIRLTACAFRGHRCGLRVLRIRNATEEPMELHLCVYARLAPQEVPLECLPGIIMTQHPVGRLHSYLAGHGGSARRCRYIASLNQTDHPSGRFAVLDFALSLAPNAMQEALWTSGHARHAEDIAAALHALTLDNASTHLLRVRTQWSFLLNRMTFSTPEESLNQLMNHMLPLQAISSDAAERILVLIHLSPIDAKRTLLKAARQAQSREDWAFIAHLTKAYVTASNDASILNVRPFPHSAALHVQIIHGLISLPLDPHGLPIGENQARTSFLMASAAQALLSVLPNSALHEFVRKLLNAADTYLWKDGCYGEPLRLDTQHLACAAYGATTRTRQAVRTAWIALYDRLHGFMKQFEAADLPPLPGLPENGGMVTADTILFLRALLATEHMDEAHELLQALNPLHHTDTPLRMETFRCAPYWLHGGMCAAPMEAGQATEAGGGIAASLLYQTVLQDVLGFHRQGSRIHIVPHVPPEWDDYTITIQEGASTWHISVERHLEVLAIDGDEIDGTEFSITDDGRIHQVRVPMK